MSDPTDQPQDHASENQKLKKENARLGKRVMSLEDSNASWWNIRFLIGKKIGEIFLGWRLSGSIKRLVKEIKDKNVQNETIGDVLTHILWRFTRVGILALLLAIVPSAILIIQVLLMRNQNRLLSIQNERIEQQNQLIEAQRRSSYVFLLGNIMDAVNDELKAESNIERKLSPQLIGQIISLSNSLTPYRFMIDSTLSIKSLSPERGMLLVFMLQSKINKDDLNAIFAQGNFNYSYAGSLHITDAKGLKLGMQYCQFSGIRMTDSQIESFACLDCQVNTILVEWCDINKLYYRSNDSLSCFFDRSKIKFMSIVVDKFINISSNDLSVERMDFISHNIEVISLGMSNIYDVSNFMADTINQFVATDLSGKFRIASRSDSVEVDLRKSIKQLHFAESPDLLIDILNPNVLNEVEYTEFGMDSTAFTQRRIPFSQLPSSIRLQ